MTTTKKLWILLAAVLMGTFAVLGFCGREVYRKAPPIPERVVTQSGRVLFTKEDILQGQLVWQSMGGQQLGTIWGHGAYQAPDWSADFLHREATTLLETWAVQAGETSYGAAGAELRAALRERLRRELRTNTHDPNTGSVVVSEARAAAIASVSAHYQALFGDDPSLRQLREDYALQESAVPDAARREKLGAFYFWTAWACATERPDSSSTYTNNWPHEPLIGNTPTTPNVVWSIVSIVLLLAGVGALVWWQAFREREEEPAPPPSRDPFRELRLTPSMKAVAKYCVVVVALFVVQCLLGALTAHYTVEGREFFGLPLADYLPYALTRTWHIQLAVFWIATAFLAAGLFLAPAVGGSEPRFQRLGVNVLFGALIVVVGGSMAGEWASIHQLLDLNVSFLFGHQGYEYVDLGRIWQIALFVGLALWLVLMLRALWPAIQRHDERRPIILLFTGATVAIGLFYGAGFFYGAKTHLSVMEYWRWWVVHLWVEGFMEVFATAAVAFVFTQLGLLQPKSAGTAVLLSTSIFLVGGVPGTFHHLYFSGTPVEIMAVGASFSALEVIPLVLIGIEAHETSKLQTLAPWMQRYRWPVRFFVGVAFWNLVGAGLFGFLINPPIALYYMQGLNTTPVHAHTALFGVYGLLSLGLVLLVVRWVRPNAVWNERALGYAFWALNVGLGLMVLLSILPIGLVQTWASVEHGLWYARSAEFMQQPLLETLRWMRFVGDTIFLSGVAAFAWFILRVFVPAAPVGSESLADLAPSAASDFGT
ncbi:MAG TPA: nitric-oxide reductase large subunit [Polyangiales bacterium]|nr:nitric-oxide reductase large subunit [Polyangiales bacterium]